MKYLGEDVEGKTKEEILNKFLKAVLTGAVVTMRTINISSDEIIEAVKAIIKKNDEYDKLEDKKIEEIYELDGYFKAEHKVEMINNANTNIDGVFNVAAFVNKLWHNYEIIKAENERLKRRLKFMEDAIKYDID